MEAEKYGPVQIGLSDSSAPSSDTDQVVAQVPTRTDGTGDGSKPHKAPPPRVRKPSPIHDHFLAPTPDLAGYRARLREAFGNTMSDEFIDVMLGKVIEALKPSPFDTLDEPILNAALAIIDSVQCRSELEALAPAWSAEPVDGAQPATLRRQARTLLVPAASGSCLSNRAPTSRSHL